MARGVEDGELGVAEARQRERHRGRIGIVDEDRRARVTRTVLHARVDVPRERELNRHAGDVERAVGAAQHAAIANRHDHARRRRAVRKLQHAAHVRAIGDFDQDVAIAKIVVGLGHAGDAAAVARVERDLDFVAADRHLDTQARPAPWTGIDSQAPADEARAFGHIAQTTVAAVG